MKIEDISREMKSQAVGLGLCEQWTNEWGNPDKQGLVDKYKKGMDFIIKHDFPSIEFMKSNFDVELRHKNLIFIDEEVSLADRNGVVVVNGNCTGTIVLKSFNACRIYVRHNSKIKFICKDFSKVFISCHDNAKINVTQEGLSKVYLYMHDNATELHNGDVQLRIK